MARKSKHPVSDANCKRARCLMRNGYSPEQAMKVIGLTVTQEVLFEQIERTKQRYASINRQRRIEGPRPRTPGGIFMRIGTVDSSRARRAADYEDARPRTDFGIRFGDPAPGRSALAGHAGWQPYEQRVAPSHY